MTDQAYKLRELIHVNKTSQKKVSTDARIIAISSGKGGVGKTNFTVNIGIALTKLNKRVTIIDADLGLANIDIILGLVPKFTLTHVLKNQKHRRHHYGRARWYQDYIWRFRCYGPGQFVSPRIRGLN